MSAKPLRMAVRPDVSRHQSGVTGLDSSTKLQKPLRTPYMCLHSFQRHTTGFFVLFASLVLLLALALARLSVRLTLVAKWRLNSDYLHSVLSGCDCVVNGISYRFSSAFARVSELAGYRKNINIDFK